VVYFNDGRGNFAQSGTFGDPTWPTRNLTTGDLNDDGKPDIVVANRDGASQTHANYLCFNDGRGRFPLPCQEVSPESATTIAVADLTGDDRLDIVVPHRDGGPSYIFPNIGRGKFGVGIPVGGGKDSSRSVGTGDLNGDGRVDLVFGDEVSGGTLIYLNTGNGQFAAPLQFGKKRPSGPNPARRPDGRLVDMPDVPYGFAVADLDNDRDLDIVVGNAATSRMILVNDGRAGFSETRLQTPHGDGTYGVAVGDLNGDGLPDIVTGGFPTQVFFQRRVR
jgi:hypothetical protein